MGLFGTEEYIDYTLLKKKGLLKIDENKKEMTTKDGFVDLTPASVDVIRKEIGNENITNSAVPNLDFLNNLVGAGADNIKTDENKENDILKTKFDELEQKIREISERVERIESKFKDHGA